MAASTWSTTDKSAAITLSGSNLIATASGSNVSIRGKDPKRTGKYYIEYTLGTVSSACIFGIATARAPLGTNSAVAGSFNVQVTTGTNVVFDSFGIQIAGMGSQSPAPTTGSLVCIAIDLDAALIWLRVGAAGNWNNNAVFNPATSVGGLGLSGPGIGQGVDAYPFAFLAASAQAVTANFGASAFTGAVPAGFTSGWDDSVTVVINEILTQIAAEEWGIGTPTLQLTQTAIEEWAAVSTGNTQLALTQIALEQWASVAVITPSIGAPMITMIG